MYRSIIADTRIKTSTSFSAGEVCAAFYPKDSLWHRAVIEKSYSTDKGPMVKALVYLFGCMMILSVGVSEIYRLW